ncbi:uncharacterized protein si:dkeyp-121d4.3 isoform X2 [Myxocyprinus asiaticus]|uniref:uncharacterized protein si:dkeyp-121d4.3 isoform X2 n=1 Tax=Myxocyprinus asiaticus TaxID=70543 RepID=UPI002222BBD3|nr:uncharacterized protein si:dkeyp-121d4.3 isoform X2 [Myxocyprinus asiaticus]
MGENRTKRGKGIQNAQLPGPGPQHGVRPAAPAPPLPKNCWSRPPPRRGGFRGPTPRHPMGPPGQRFPGPPHDYGPQPSRMRMMDNMAEHRQFMNEPHEFMNEPPEFMMREQMIHDEPLHPLDFPDRPGFRPPPFNDADPRFDSLEFECGPRFRPPDFCPPEFRARPSNFFRPEFERVPAGVRSPEFDDRPGFPMMNPGVDPMERFGPRDPHFMQPGNHAFGDRGGFAAPPQDFLGPGPVPPPPPPPSETSKDTKIEPSKTMASKLAMFKNISANTPRGRSLGVISFIGNNCGFIEREDLKKFSFVFDAFIGKRSNLVPGVKVHFTALKNLGKECAVDVKVAPRGTEDIDNTVYEGVVTTALPDGNVKEPNPGCIRTILSVDPIKLPFGKQDTNVTLLLYDRVEFQLLTDLITMEKRATNIKPKTPETFQLTKEIREMGVIINKTDGTLTITTEKHNNLTASAADNLSEDELNTMDEVELTVITVDDTKKAVRLKKLPVGSVTFNQQANGTENISGVKDKMPGTAPVKDKWKPVTSEAGSQELVVSYDVSSEKYEGMIVKIVPKNSKTQEMEQMDKQEPAFGLLVTKVEGTEERFSFKSGDVITKATMMVGDKVQFNISTNSITKEECAVNLEILPDTFQMESEEQRKIGLVVKLDDNSGFVKTQQDPQIFFDMSEVMEETKLSLYEKVEFTLVPNEAAGEGNRAVRIRRLNESVFSSAPKLEAFGVKEKQKKMTIKLLKDPKDFIKEEVKAEDKSSESMDVVKLNKENDKALPPMTLKDLKKEREMKKEKTKPKGDLAQSRSRESSRRRYSRSRSKSRSQERSSSYYRRRRSSSREKMDSRYRRSRSRDCSDKYRRSRSRSRERSSWSSRKRSHSPDVGDDRYKKQSSSKESGNKKIGKNPEDSVNEEILRKRRELMELNELIARKKAIVAMEQNVKKIEPEVEVDIERGITTFDYQHVHRENMWMPDLKPVKSILKKQSELPDPQSQVSTCKETAFVKSESLDMQIGCHQRISAFELNASPYSKFESDSKKSLTTEGSENIPLPEFEDPVLVRKKKQLEELSESIARKRAIIAMEQKTKAFRDAPAMEKEYEFDSHSDDQFVMSKENLWSSDIKTDVQPKKSILKKRSELLSSQSETTSVDDYGQSSRDDFVFTKIPSQSTAAALFDRSSNPQPVHSDTLGLFNRLLKESSATLHVAEPSHFNKPVVPQSVTQASNLRSLHDPKPSSLSKGCNSQDDQHRASSHQTNEHPHSSNPSSSQAAPLEQKRSLTTQMERFLSALNKADSSIVNSLFQEARKDQALMSTQNPSQPQLDMNIPFMDELYDPFKEDEDNDQHRFIGRGVGKHSLREQIKSPVKTESHFYDPNKDDLLPHERAVQDGSRFSWLVGMKEDLEPFAKAEKKKPYGHQLISNNWNTHEEDPNRFSKGRNQNDEDTDLYATEHKHYGDDNSVCRERSQSVEYQNVHPNVQHTYLEESEMPDSKFDKSIVRQQSEESNEDKDKKTEHFEKIQSLLQTVGLHLDTAEVGKLADRTRERLYGKTIKPHSASYSFDQKRERSMSGSERRGSNRADSSDSDGFRSVSPAQSSNRKVYMSYKDSVIFRDEHKVEDVDLTSLKRTIMNLKSTNDAQKPSRSESTTASQVLYQPASMYVVSTAQPGSSQYAQISTIPTLSASQYYYHSNEQNLWGSASPLDSSQNTNLQYSAYPYGTVPLPPNLGYASGQQAMAPHMMSSYSSYTTQMGNPYPVPPLTMPIPYGLPPISNPLLLSSTNSSYTTLHAGQNLTDKKTQPVRCLKTIETTETVVTAVNVKGEPKGIPKNKMKVNNSPARNLQEIKLVSSTTEDDIKAKQKKRLEQFNQRMKLKKEQQMEAQRSRGQNRNSAPGTSTPSEIKNVWICGHSLVFWAEKRATSPEFGMQLGMHPDSVRIWWKGVQGMKWEQLLPLLLQLKDNWPKPDVLIIHLGGNDISTTAPEVFIETVKKDLTSIKSIFPECLLVWSDTLQRQTWRGTEDNKEMEIFRMAINDSIHHIMTELGGSSLSHGNIRTSLGLYRPDGIHLSGKGIDTFNLNLQDFLEKWESEIESKTETSDPSIK